MSESFCIVGQGPVGLFLASLLLLQNKTVYAFEKRQTYTRSALIRMWPGFYTALFTHPLLASKQGCELKQTITSLPHFLPINDLEKSLLAWNQKHSNYHIIYKEVSRRKDVIEYFKEHKLDLPNRIFVCDGAQSTWRNRYFHSGQQFVEHILSVESPAKHGRRGGGFSLDTLIAINKQRVVYYLSKHSLHIPLNDEEFKTLSAIPGGKLIPLKDLAITLNLPANSLCHVFDYKLIWSSSSSYQNITLVGDALFVVSNARSLRNGLICALHAVTMNPIEFEYYYRYLQFKEKYVSYWLGKSTKDIGMLFHNFAAFFDIQNKE